MCVCLSLCAHELDAMSASRVHVGHGIGCSIVGQTKSTAKVGLVEYCWDPLQIDSKWSDTVPFSAQIHRK